jgi:Matrixin
MVAVRQTLLLLCIFSLCTETFSKGHCIGAQIPQVLPQLRSMGPTSTKPASCKTSATAESQGLELVNRTTLFAFTKPITYVTLLSAGKFVALHFPVNAIGTPKIAIHVWNKNEDDGPFEKVCDRILPYRLPVAFEVESPQRLSGSIWRLEFTLEGYPGMKTPQTPVEVFRTVGSGFNPDFSVQHGSWHEALGFLCLGGDLYKSFSTSRSSAGFAGRIRLDVNTDDDKMPLSPPQHQALNTLILEGISLWVSGCRECRVDHLVAVNIGDALYVRQGLHEWYEREFSSSVLNTNQLLDLENSLRNSLESKILLRAGPYIHEEAPRRKEFSPYILEQPGSFRLLCASEPNAKQTPLLWNIRQALCFPERLDKSSFASIRVRFRDGRTACGMSANIIACRADSELTEFNIRDFRFSFPDTMSQPIGDGPVEVSFLHVLMHEMGHWIGLQHINGGHSIMASSMDQSRCVDLPTMLSLARFDSANSIDEKATPMAFTLTAQRTRKGQLGSRR